MSDTLRETITATQENYRSQPNAANASFQSNSRLERGLRSDVSIRQHNLVIDEPPQLGGDDSGPNPVELVLAALGSCQEITYKAYATVLGINVESVSVKLEGDIDLRGFFGVDDSVRAGFHNIRGEVFIESDAPRADLERLKEAVDAHCPVLDMLSTPVPVSIELASS